MNIASLLEILSYNFMQNALIASIFMALILPFIGILTYTRKMGFIADAIGHINLSGIAFAIFAGSTFAILPENSFVISLAFTLLGAVLIEFLREKFINYKEVSIILVYALAVALTIVFLNLSEGYNAKLLNILFGNINAISDTEVTIIVISTIVLLIIFKFIYKKLVLLSLEENYIKMYGINFNIYRYVYIIIVTIVIALAIKLIGVLLVTSLLVIPLLSANEISNTFKKTLISSIIITELSMVLGIIIGYYINISASAVIVLISFFIYIVLKMYKYYIIKSN